MDINKVWLTGQAITAPTQETINSRTKITFFILLVNEEFQDREGNKRRHENKVRIESLGKSSNRAMETVKKGGRYTVDGFIRQDYNNGKDDVRVRAFAIIPDKTSGSDKFNSGLATALHILEESLDKESAKEKIKELLSTDK